MSSLRCVRPTWFCIELAARLKLRHGNAQALGVMFGGFYKLKLSISFFLRHNVLLHLNAHLRNEVGYAFKDMPILVSDVTVAYRNKIRGISFCNNFVWINIVANICTDISSGPVRVDFNKLFGRQMVAFSGRKNHIVDAMWEYQLGNGIYPRQRRNILQH